MIRCPYCDGPVQHLSAKQVARLLGVSHQMVSKYIAQGRFPGTEKVRGVTTPWIYKIPVSAVLPMIEARNEARVRKEVEEEKV